MVNEAPRTSEASPSWRVMYGAVWAHIVLLLKVEARRARIARWEQERRAILIRPQLCTVEPLLIPIGGRPRVWVMGGYGRLWVMRGRFWCKFQFRCGQNLWVMGGYGIREVWVKRGSTVVPICAHMARRVAFRMSAFGSCIILLAYQYWGVGSTLPRLPNLKEFTCRINLWQIRVGPCYAGVYQ